MIELPIIFISGMLGSAHCIGMCGGFALSIGMGANNAWQNLQRQLLYSLGRLFTYGVIGACAGFTGRYLGERLELVTNFQAALSIVAGLLLIYQGLRTLGWLPPFNYWRRLLKTENTTPTAEENTPFVILNQSTENNTSCLAGSFFASFLKAPGLSNVFIAGVLTGFLPCGLVYAYLTLAVSSGNLLTGMLTMTLFGLGTVPVMLLTGVGGSLIGNKVRVQAFRIAAGCIAIMGIMTIARGMGAMDIPGWYDRPGCPLCLERGEAETANNPDK